MVSKKKSKNSTPVHTNRIIKNIYRTFVILSIIILSVTVVLQQKTIQSLNEYDYKNLSADINAIRFDPLTIDIHTQKAYIPQAQLEFDYTKLASSVRYQLLNNNDDTAMTDIIITFVEKYQLIDSAYSVDMACTNPFLLLIGQEVPEGYVLINTKVLNDGRSVKLAASVSKECSGYVQGLIGVDFIALLNTVQSY